MLKKLSEILKNMPHYIHFEIEEELARKMKTCNISDIEWFLIIRASIEACIEESNKIKQRQPQKYS